MELTILGSAGTHTGPGSACSGYLLRTSSTTLLIDAGNGSTARLQQLIPLSDLDAVLVSHMHADHCVDLIGLHHAMRSQGIGGVPMHGPREVTEFLAQLTSREAPYVFEDSFEVEPVVAGDRVAVGDLEVAFHHSVHTTPTVSMRIVSGGRTFVFSGDSAGGPDLIEAARGADLFLCEATWQGQRADHPPGIHLTAEDAGRVATVAGAERLVLTHVLGSLDREVSRREAAATYGGPLHVARDGDVFTV